MIDSRQDSIRRIYFNRGTLPFWGIHAAALLGVLLLGLSWSGALWALSAYVARMFFVTAGYHRYFSHRSFKTTRWFQVILAVLSQASGQRGVLWWASRHRQHHREADSEEDLHSPMRHGFFWSHAGWMLCNQYDETAYEELHDFNKYPELRWLDRHPHIPLLALGISFYAIGGIQGLVWGYFVSTVLVWHATFSINSLSHLIGKRRYNSPDDSRNNWLLALITLGEGWHNNHHHYQSSTAQGFYWWELDITMVVLRLFQRLGLVYGVRSPPRFVVEGRRRAGFPVTELAFGNEAALAMGTSEMK